MGAVLLFLVFLFLAVMIIGLVLLQEGKGGGLTGTSAGMDGVMGAKNPLRRMTAYLFAAFVILAVCTNVYLHNRSQQESALPAGADNIPAGPRVAEQSFPLGDTTVTEGLRPEETEPEAVPESVRPEGSEEAAVPAELLTPASEPEAAAEAPSAAAPISEEAAAELRPEPAAEPVPEPESVQPPAAAAEPEPAAETASGPETTAENE